MFNMKDEEHMEDLLWIPYAWEDYDPENIKETLDYFKPDNMYAIYHSQLLKKEMESNPEAFQTERFYTKHFTVEELSDDYIQKLSEILPEEGMKLDFAPPNHYMPEIDNLKNMKKQRDDPEKPGVPKLLANDTNFEIWFKQDDTFDQPYIWINAKILTNDCNFALDE